MISTPEAIITAAEREAPLWPYLQAAAESSASFHVAGATQSYADLAERSARLAAGLRRAGV